MNRNLSTMSVEQCRQLASDFCAANVLGTPEDDHHVNALSRRTIAAMAEEHGEAWIGKVNRYGDAEKQAPPVWKWDGGMVYNFGAAFVVPHYDAELERLILDREAAPYTGTATDRPRVEAIHQRVYDLGGDVLFWA